MDAISCTVTLTQQDFVRFHYWAFSQRVWRIALMYGAVITVMIGITLWQSHGNSVRPERLALIITASLLLVGIWAMSPYWTGRREFRRSPLNSCHYDFSTNNWKFRTDGCDATFDWAIVLKAQEAPHFLLLMTDENVFHILPTSAFTQNDLPRFRKLLSEQLGDRWHPAMDISARTSDA